MNIPVGLFRAGRRLKSAADFFGILMYLLPLNSYGIRHPIRHPFRRKTVRLFDELRLPLRDFELPLK